LNGRFGPYISYDKGNFKIPKTTDPAKLTLAECIEIVSQKPAAGKGKFGTKSTAKEKPAAKTKSTATKTKSATKRKPAAKK
ncbi:MAG: topoisomerase C-terminal repeat-containing protein, partial [Bacteroidia bacterium]